MPRFRPALLAVAAGAAGFTGCITFYSKTEVVRGGETRVPVRFESPEAAKEFRAAAASRGGEVGGEHVGVPFVTLYHRREKLSDAAAWNDAVMRCDTDGDGQITHSEAVSFAAEPQP